MNVQQNIKVRFREAEEHLGAFWSSNYERTLFLMGLIIILVYSIFYNSMLRVYLPFQGKWSLLACVLLAISELLTIRRTGFIEYFWRIETAIGICVILVSLVVTFSCGSSTPFIVSLFVYGARRFSFEDIAWTAIASVTTSCIVIIACAVLNVIDDVVWVQGERVRHGLGMRYTTTLSHYVFFCTLLFIYVRRSNLTLAQSLVILSIDVTVFLLTNSRNSFGLTVAAIILAWVARRFDLRQPCKRLRYLLSAAFPFFATISIALMLVYSPNVAWQSRLNTFFGGRLGISHRSYQLYGIKPFGQDQEFVGQGIEDDGQKYDGPVTVIDNSYCNLLVTKGPIFTIAVVAALAILILNAASCGSVIIVVILLLVSLHSITDPQLITLQFDIPILLIGPCLLGTEEVRAREFSNGIPLCGAALDKGQWKAALVVSAALLAPAFYMHSMDSLRPPQGIKVMISAKSDQGGSDYYSDYVAPVISYNDFDAILSGVTYRPGDLHIKWNASLSPLTTGVYEFAVDGEGSVLVILDRKIVLNVPRLDLFTKSVSKEAVELRADSYHPLQVVWVNNDSGNSLHLYWRTIGNDEWHMIPYNCYSLLEE